MQEIDRRAQEEFGIPAMILMENAGLKCARALRRIMGTGPLQGPVTVAAGKGNNGGDGFVVARHLHLRGLTPRIVLCQGKPQEGNPAVNLEICRRLGIPIIDFTGEREAASALLKESGWIVDAILGTGVKGPVRGELADIIGLIAGTSARKVSIDIPSGLGDDFKPRYPVISADYTLTLGLPKTCLYIPSARKFCGRIICLEIGFPGTLVDDEEIPGELLSDRRLADLVRPFSPDVHKNSRGHAAVFAGSEGTTGAAFLASSACSRSRCGLVTLFTDRAVYPVLATQLSAVMVRPWDPGSDPKAFDDERFNAFLLGPGWGTDRTRHDWLGELVARGKPGVIDADGLTVLGEMLGKKKMDFGGKWVITPHPAEFARVSGLKKEQILKQPLPAVTDFSRKHGLVTVLKGAVTWIASPEGRYFALDRRNPAMATGGTGDVLSGIIAGFLASGMEPVEAAVAGVLVHSICGKTAYKERGWFIATDLLPYISAVLGRSVHG
jgi:ADP-dependent NAD(P)H-hydrate dehydratase / NAD(P)H-hydrate epimerase